MSTEFLQLPPPALRAFLPWILIGVGFVAQFSGARLLIGRHRQSTAEELRVTDCPSAPEDDAAAPLSLEMPIEGAHVPTNPELLPGARRAYRGGEHQGVDFSCRPGTPVVAAADGWVLSIADEPDLPKARRDELLGYCKQLGETPPEVLGVLHGRRVTLCHGLREGQLLTTSYSHLGDVSPDIKPGVRVRLGDAIGETGASGTSHAFGDSRWSELHFEVHLNGVPLGEGLAPREAGALYRQFLRGEVPQ